MSQEVKKNALLSDDGVYRYWLSRSWEPTLPQVCWIMLNPSTACASYDDATIRKCIRFSQSEGFGSLIVLNLYAYRATEPTEMFERQKAGTNIVGPDNNMHLAGLLPKSGVAVAAWGASEHITRERVQFVKNHCENLHCLRVGKTGSPYHPLYLPLSLSFKPWRAA